ncbi:phosphotransferase [Thermobifida halotolerans]|uniref:Phosphotransferase n=1 Tax=Thermobifida halotolerans TaxID=483545 RepID=A0AA97LU67_9ACTN|nr:phosphotransferase [Thermobifida halotolerans]UOE18157.1 phosphotransferase [Thermobifida halotolerans]
MHHSADEELTRADPRLPGLGVLLSSRSVLDLLDSLLPTGVERPRRVEVERGRYLRGTGLAATLTLHYADGPRHAFARALPPDAAGTAEEVRYARQWTGRPDGRTVDLGALEEPRLRGPLCAADLGLVLGPPVDDRALPSVRRFAAVPQRFVDTADASAHTLSYLAGHRWVGRIDDAAGHPRLVVHARSGGVNAASHLAPAVAGLPVPDLVRVSRYGLLVTRWLPGEPLDRLAARDGAAGRAALAETGRLLARLHSVPPPRELPPADPAPRVARAAEEVAALLPGLAGRVRAAARECAAALDDVSDAPRALVHGGLHAGRVLVGDGGPALTCLEEAHVAHPATDLADLAAAEYARRPAGGAPPSVPEALLDGYLDGLGSPAAAERTRRGLGAHSAAALLRRATVPFRLGAADWDARVTDLVAAAETALAAR